MTAVETEGVFKIVEPFFGRLVAAVVLDTPLLAYREPEGEEDDLSGTDVQDRFYDYLLALGDRQIIILENVDPPETIKAGQQAVFFSRKSSLGPLRLLSDDAVTPGALRSCSFCRLGNIQEAAKLRVLGNRLFKNPI